MKITLTHSEKEFYDTVAWRIIAQVLGKPASVIGLSTGRTTKGVHAVIVDIFQRHPFDVSQVTVFNADEVTNVSRDFPGSCYAMILNEIVLPLGIPGQNYLMPASIADDYDLEARSFEQRLAARGPVDLQILGIGENGHIGFNQPGTPFGSHAWHSRMDAELEARLRRETQAPADLHLGGLTLGIQTLMNSRRIVLVANGRRKSRIIEATLKGPVTEAVPASVLQLHPDCEAILDPEAGELL